MPVYLAKDYLSEHLNSNLEFLSRCLITEPKHLESENQYPHNYPNKLADGIQSLLLELQGEVSKDEVEELLKHEKDPTQLNFVGCDGLEGYEDPPEEQANQSNNIIQIDSDSDFDIGSSFGSNVVSVEEINKKVDSLMNPSLCSDEIKRSLPQDDWYIDIIEDDMEEMHIHSSAAISALMRRLKPVRVSDPLAELSKFKGAMQLCSLSPLKEEEEKESRRCDASNMEFLREEMNYDVGVELYLESSLYEVSCESTFVVDDILQVNLQTFLAELTVEQVPDEGESLKLNWTPSQLQVERITMNEIASTPKKVEPEKTEISQSFTPAHVSPEERSKQLDCPETSFIIRMGEQKDLPDICEGEAVLPENDKQFVFSPSSVRTISKKCFKGEMDLVDMSEMLLPEEDESDTPTVEPIILPLDSISKISMDAINEALEWDPLEGRTNLIEGTEKSLLEKVVPRNQRISPLLHAEFVPVPLGCDDGDMKIDDWRQQEKRILSLKYITSCKKAAAADDIPMAKGSLNAPAGYNNPKFIDRKSLINPKPPPLNQITPIPHAKKGGGRLTQNEDEVYQSPLDSFMMLRMAKTPQSAVPDPRNRVASAAKVLPVEKHDFSSNSMSKGKDLMRKSEKGFSDWCENSSVREKSDKYGARGEKGERREDTKQEQQVSQNQQDRKEKQHTRSNQQSKSKDGPPSDPQQTTEDIIQIKYSGKYLTFISEITEDLQTLLQYLRHHGCVAQDCTLLSLSIDRTKFLAKQEQRRYRDGTISKDVLCGSLCLYAVMMVLDTVVNCNVLAACSILKEYTLRYQSVLDNCLEPLHKKLSSFYCSSEEVHVVHPKLKKVQDLLLTWLKGNKDTKTLLIIPRMFDYIAPNLQTFVSAIQGVQLNVHPERSLTEDAYVKVFQSSNVILAHKQEDLLGCPWKFFNNVILFEGTGNHSWKTTALQNKFENFVTFKKFEMDSFVADVDHVSTRPAAKQIDATVVCSTAVVADKDLLVALESKCDVQMVVKKYEHIKEVLVSEFRWQPDILIDEKTGVVVVYAANMIDEREIGVACQKVLSVVLKCSATYVLLYRENQSKSVSANIQNIVGKLVSQISLLISSLHAEFPEVTCKLLQCFSAKDVAKKIQGLCSSIALPKSNKEQWLEEELTSSEKFLMAYPSVNALTAKLMSQKFASVKALFKLSVEELRKQFPSLPVHVLNSFYNMNQTTYESMVYLQNTAHIMESVRQPADLRTTKDVPAECIVIEDELNSVDNNLVGEMQPALYRQPQQTPTPPETQTIPRSTKMMQRASSLSMPNIASSVNRAGGNMGHFGDRHALRPSNTMAPVNLSGRGGTVAIPSVLEQSNHGASGVAANHACRKSDRMVPALSSLNKENSGNRCEDRIVPCTSVDIGHLSSYQNAENSLYDLYETQATHSNHRNSNSSAFHELNNAPVHGSVDAQLVPDNSQPISNQFGRFQFDNGDYVNSQDSVESFKLNLPPVEDVAEPCPLLDGNNCMPPYYNNNNSNNDTNSITTNNNINNNYHYQDENQMYYGMAGNAMPSNMRQPFSDISNIQHGYPEVGSGGSTYSENIYSYKQVLSSGTGQYDLHPSSNIRPTDNVFGNTAPNMQQFVGQQPNYSTRLSKDYSISANPFSSETTAFTNSSTTDFSRYSHTSSHFNENQMNNVRFDNNTVFQNSPHQHGFSASDSQRRSFWQKDGFPKEVPKQAVKAFAMSIHNNEGRSSNSSPWDRAPSETKKRRLGFKKVPGAKGGQTKLTFV